MKKKVYVKINCISIYQQQTEIKDIDIIYNSIKNDWRLKNNSEVQMYKNNTLKNTKILKNILKNLNIEREIPCSWVRRLNIVKTVSQIDVLSQSNSNKNHSRFTMEMYQLVLKFILKYKKPWIAETFLRKNSNLL